MVGDPEMVRWGLEGFQSIIDNWFLPDGSTSESPAYALQVLDPLWKMSEILEGYSDPEGYVDANGNRIDNLSIYKDPKYHAVWNNMYLSLLPDLRYPPIADSYVSSTLGSMMTMIMALRYDNPEYKGLLRNRLSSLRNLMMYQDASLDLRYGPGAGRFQVSCCSRRGGWVISFGPGRQRVILILNMSIGGSITTTTAWTWFIGKAAKSSSPTCWVTCGITPMPS